MASVTTHPLDCGNPPVWASAWGEDRYGVFVAFSVGEVEQRMRWIPPGTFWMGSPEDEEGRGFDEDLHQVTLKKGFWLSDTPCTQALWEELAEENPSWFRSPARPVEQVSWEEATRFLNQLAYRLKGLDPRLPTEAEWEYACRAGTKTATYAGPMEILGRNNAPILDAIAWYGGNGGVGFDLENGSDSSSWPEKQLDHERAGTHLVGQKAANRWGLFDMLGNVWEWCHDWHVPYEPKNAGDPEGPAKGWSRVARGGAWDSDARFVRAAYRGRKGLTDRNSNLGFRIARDQD